MTPKLPLNQAKKPEKPYKMNVIIQYEKTLKIFLRPHSNPKIMSIVQTVSRKESYLPPYVN